LGCNPIVLLGQDLAFQGTQQYAGNYHVQFDENGHFTLPDSEEQIGRTLYFKEVKGQQGETLRTSPDYLAFLHQLEAFAKNCRKEAPDLRLYNASVGGAWIEGFTHLSIDQLPETLMPLNKGELIPPFPRADGTETRKRLFSSLNQVLTEIQGAIRLAGFCVEQIHTIIQSPSREALEVLLSARSNFLEILQRDPFIYSSVSRQVWFWNRNMGKESHSFEEDMKNLEIEATYIDNIRKTLQDELKPCVETVLEQLQEQLIIPV
jgi:hypothetical protein